MDEKQRCYVCVLELLCLDCDESNSHQKFHPAELNFMQMAFVCVCVWRRSAVGAQCCVEAQCCVLCAVGRSSAVCVWNLPEMMIFRRGLERNPGTPSSSGGKTDFLSHR